MSKNIHYPIVLLIIAALCVAGIDIVYSSVKEKIEEADNKKALEAVCSIYQGCAQDQMEKKESKHEGDMYTWFVCPAGYAIIVDAQGFDGAVTVMVGWDKPLGKLIGIFVLKHTETPGLGGNVDLVESANTWFNVITGSMKDETGARPGFQVQFNGLGIEDAKLKSNQGKIDALPGATITSVAVINAVHKSHEILKAILEAESKSE